MPPTPPEPPGLDDGTAAAVLDEAEEILNAAGIRSEPRSKPRTLRKPGMFKRLFGRKR